MREITIRVRLRNHSNTVQLWADLMDSANSHLTLARGRETAQWRRAPGEDLGEQELWELMLALRNEIEAWQAKLPLDY